MAHTFFLQIYLYKKKQIFGSGGTVSIKIYNK